jgi:AcrR family transcriptional regulator
MSELAARRYSGRPVEEWKAARRERLLAAALDLFGTEGYQVTSIERLCSTARVSTRHFYQEFANKQAVLLEVYAGIIQSGIEATAAALVAAPERPVQVRMSLALTAYLETVTTDLRKSRISFVEVVGASVEVEARRMAFREMIIATIVYEGQAAVQRGEIPGRDFRFMALALIGSVNVIVYDWMVKDPRPPAEELWESLVQLALGLLALPGTVAGGNDA